MDWTHMEKKTQNSIVSEDGWRKTRVKEVESDRQAWNEANKKNQPP